MQDKDMDELFGSKLNDFEVQPSALVWDNITNELGAGKRRKRLVPLLSIAASVIVLLAAGILFIPQKQNPVKNTHAIAKSTAPVLKVDTAKKITNGAAYSIIAKNNGSNPVKITKAINIKKHIAVDTAKPVNTVEQPVLANVSQQPQEVIKPVVPDEDITLKPMEMPVLGAKQTLANAQLPNADKQNVKPVKKKHRLNTFGDMVNAVVAKIDKRQNKFIEFSNTDGDEATITSVNLGLVKIKKEDKVD